MIFFLCNKYDGRSAKIDPKFNDSIFYPLTKTRRVDPQVEKLMEEKRNGPFQGSALPPVPLSSMGKKKEFVVPETECWDDDNEPPFSLQFDLAVKTS